MPSIYWLPDKNGELQPVINFPLEEFERLRDLQSGGAGDAAPPAYGLALAISGQVRERTAELSVQFTVDVREERWLRIPLYLPEAIKVGAEKYTGAGEAFVDLEESGYVLWLRGPKGKHVVEFDAAVPVVSIGRESRLKLGLPRATASRADLTVPEENARGQLAQGLIKVREKAAEHATRFLLEGLGGELDFSWRGGEDGMTATPVVLSAVGTIDTQIDGRSATSEARLQVASREGEFDRFRVRLPIGAELVQRQQPGVTLVPVAESDDGGLADSVGRLYEARLDERSTEFTLQLVTEQVHRGADPEVFLDLAGFEVVGAVPQTGHMAVSVVGDWQVVWGNRRNVRQVATTPPPLEAESLAGAFEYLNQPCSLQARVVPRTSRVAVDPQYVFFVDADQVRLEATLHYTIRGAKVFGLELVWNDADWQIDEIGPANVVDLFGVDFDQLDPLSIPLLQPATGELGLVVRAHRPLEDGAKLVNLSLPRPQVNSVGPASVVVVAADNVELTPRSDEMTGLAQAPPDARLELPARQREPLYYRGDVNQARFAADLQVRPREVTATLHADIELDQSQSRVDEHILYRVAHEPVSQLTLRSPAELLAANGLEVLVDGASMEFDRLDPATLGDGDELDSGDVVIRVRLPAPRIGPCDVRVRFALSGEPLEPQATLVREIPLALPIDCDDLRAEALVRAPRGIELQPRDANWKPSTASTVDAAGGVTLLAERPTTSVSVAANLEDPQALDGAWVSRAWIQSWIGADGRRDRATLRLRSRREQLAIELPSGASTESLKIWLDGRPTTPSVSRGAATVTLDDQTDEREHVLEVAYQFDARPARGELRLAAPRLGGTTLVERTYWQVILPPDEHLVLGDESLARAFDWTWSGAYWARRPWWGQSQLEAWSGATRIEELPRGVNQYLFSALGPASVCHLHTAHRATLVLLASGGTLVAGLLLIYARPLRHRAVFLVAGVTLAAAALMFPDYALLIAQAAGAGVMLAVVAWLLEALAARRRIQPALPMAGSGSERRSTGSASQRNLVGSLESTDTSPVAAEASAPDSTS